MLTQPHSSALIGFVASALSDVCSNSIRVVKVYKQVHISAWFCCSQQVIVILLSSFLLCILASYTRMCLTVESTSFNSFVLICNFHVLSDLLLIYICKLHYDGRINLVCCATLFIYRRVLSRLPIQKSSRELSQAMASPDCLDAGMIYVFCWGSDLSLDPCLTSNPHPTDLWQSCLPMACKVWQE